MTQPTGPAALEKALLDAIGALDTAPVRADVEAGQQSPLPGETLWRIFDAQVTSRHLDVVARELQAAGRGFYTIGSAGHESNAAVAAALRPTDPALLHYRSGGFYVARAGQVDGSTPVRDVLRSLTGAADEPIAGGRHKVFGHPALSVIPQTSTIASHLPRAVGLAVALHRARRLGADVPWPDPDTLVVCSFGDASANHSTAAGAINTAVNTAFRGLPVPLLLVCEDNGLGISVPTPSGWIETTYGSRPGLAYVAADGTDTAGTYRAAARAAHLARTEQRPVFLHLRTVRYLGHAGSDAEISYRTTTGITDDYRHDPILGTAAELVRAGAATGAQTVERYRRLRADVDAAVDDLDSRTLSSAAEIVAPLSPRTPDRVADTAAALRPAGDRAPATLAESINTSLAGALDTDRRVVVFGEDVARKGGVYGVTRGLARRFGQARVFDTLLDEQSILGLGLGAGLAGLLPVPEIQYLAYLHNAEDQLRGEAASLSFFSRAQYRNPLVVRVAGLAYQRGFGGHFHNDNGVAVLRDIPGLVVACPARGDDAAAMLRTCLAAGSVDGTVSAFLEPIALYHTRDLHEDGDGGWLAADAGHHVPIGRARRYGDGADVTVVTFGNGVRMSLRVARRLAARAAGPVGVRVLDLRWLAPLPVEDILREANATGRVLVADETRHAGGVGEGVVTALVEAGFDGPVRRVSSTDSFVPLGTAAQHVLLSEHEIETAAVQLAEKE
ncbi:2-oxoisovalerate dehydrogenase E1 component [Haloactinopolyspora alba]|uniref:2-oxoisovalerate dehydrogenase E1 component n=1 Tax=Haloactinopolyspora alba TaxID=648780 RepID=A0A2P8DYA5_9ACTN|nr:thiamine pyrophosphate-dependent enzyme [Haloactinopolyspora alba]PSL02191.1 2-oxoisovalerate dehydrogenase E1 component [Haloactinopolyspora alba]